MTYPSFLLSVSWTVFQTCHNPYFPSYCGSCFNRDGVLRFVLPACHNPHCRVTFRIPRRIAFRIVVSRSVFPAVLRFVFPCHKTCSCRIVFRIPLSQSVFRPPPRIAVCIPHACHNPYCCVTFRIAVSRSVFPAVLRFVFPCHKTCSFSYCVLYFPVPGRI